MEILLLQDVAGVGKKNDLLVVGDGFALNCLLPERKALVATPTVRKRYADQIRKRAEEKETEKNLQQQMVNALAGKPVQFSRKVTKTGKLYAAITEQNIVEALKDQHNVTVAAEGVVIPEPIKAVGTFQVQIRVAQATHPLTVIVNEEKEAAKEAPAKAEKAA